MVAALVLSLAVNALLLAFVVLGAVMSRGWYSGAASGGPR